MKIVLDASVIVKWLLMATAPEAEADLAAMLMRSVFWRRHKVLQPTHWLAEVAAVVSRRSPVTAVSDVLRSGSSRAYYAGVSPLTVVR